MPINVQCPACKSKFRADDKLAGRRGKCPKCSAVIEVPLSGQQQIFQTGVAQDTGSQPSYPPPSARNETTTTPETEVTTTSPPTQWREEFDRGLVISARIFACVLFMAALLFWIAGTKETTISVPNFVEEKTTFGMTTFKQVGETEAKIDRTEAYWNWVLCPLIVGIFLLIRTFLPVFGLIRGMLCCIGSFLIVFPLPGLVYTIQNPRILLDYKMVSFLVFDLLFLLLGFMPRRGFGGLTIAIKKESLTKS